MSVQADTEELASATPARIQGLAAALWLRTIVLLAAGAAIAFTAPSHADPRFSLLVLGLSLLLLGCATLIEFLVQRRERGAWLIAIRAIAAFGAGGVFFGLLAAVNGRDFGGENAYAVVNPALSAEFAVLAAQVLAGWAIVTVAVTLSQLYLKVLPKNVAIPSAALSALLALTVLLFNDDFVAIIGFFGAYAVVRAVFLGISVFDMKSPAANERTLATT